METNDDDVIIMFNYDKRILYCSKQAHKVFGLDKPVSAEEIPNFTWSDWLQQTNEDLDIAFNRILKNPRVFVARNFILNRKKNLPKLILNIQAIPLLPLPSEAEINPSLSVSKVLMVFSDIKVNKSTIFISCGETGLFNNIVDRVTSMEHVATIVCICFDSTHVSDHLVTKILMMISQSGGVIHEFGVDYMICIWGIPFSQINDAENAVLTSKKILDLVLMESFGSISTGERKEDNQLGNRQSVYSGAANKASFSLKGRSIAEVKPTGSTVIRPTAERSSIIDNFDDKHNNRHSSALSIENKNGTGAKVSASPSPFTLSRKLNLNPPANSRASVVGRMSIIQKEMTAKSLFAEIESGAKTSVIQMNDRGGSVYDRGAYHIIYIYI